MSKERLQKIIARAGLASRREAEKWIEEGLITINGKKAKLGEQADPDTDAIKIKGKLLQLKPAQLVYYAFYKPRGVICMLTEDEERNRKTLSDFVGKLKPRVFPIGRMDYNGEGLVLLTNDGKFAKSLIDHKEVLRFYEVKIKGHLDPEMLERLARGARMDSGFMKPVAARVSERLKSKSLVELVFKGMGALDVKEFVESRGFLVEKVVRSGIGQITLKGLTPGAYKNLKKSQVLALLEQPELGERLIQLPDKTEGLTLGTKRR